MFQNSCFTHSQQLFCSITAQYSERAKALQWEMFDVLSVADQAKLLKERYCQLEELQKDLDQWLHQYNHYRPHSGRYCYGKTPMQTFNESKHIALEKEYGKPQFRVFTKVVPII